MFNVISVYFYILCEGSVFGQGDRGSEEWTNCEGGRHFMLEHLQHDLSRGHLWPSCYIQVQPNYGISAIQSVQL